MQTMRPQGWVNVLQELSEQISVPQGVMNGWMYAQSVKA